MAPISSVDSGQNGPLARVLRSAGDGTLDALTNLSGADLTTLLLAVMRRRAGELSAPDVLNQYRADRFVAPAAVPFRRLRDTENTVLSALPPEFEPLTLAPLAPLGTHSVLGTVDQNNVITTVRRTEVAADPTNGLALEAAARRGALLHDDPRATTPVRLATLQRVVRAQRFSGPASFAHFTLLAAVSAGRDTGNLAFERDHAIEHTRLAVAAIHACTAAPVQIRITTWDPRYAPVADAVHDALATHPAAEVIDHPDRPTGRGYYTGFCYKFFSLAATEPFEVGDGGSVPWTQSLLGNRKERLLTLGIGLDRLATPS
jgi:hypothetical protein